METRILIARLRQLHAVDKNILPLYTELARIAPDEAQRALFARIAEDEKRHARLSEELLSLLEK